LGIKAYDLVSGDLCLKSSYYLNHERALELFPMLKRDKLKGAIVYYDGKNCCLKEDPCQRIINYFCLSCAGTHNDARMCLSIGITAARHGATIANHTKVTDLVKDEKGEVCGAKMRDELTGDEWTTRAKCVVNATGPFTDKIRKMDNQEAPDIVCPSSGKY
jgi:glycerol-3-phosphate dehydrogenase